ncbi:MAG TPA: exosome complex protein Rrp42 [Candidatus Nanoarchaeia archaeon]|nr:exosome complex protein Rrp42 [Candidatus Nanoarchaeia archaeon]
MDDGLRSHVLELLSKGVRLDGRKPLDYRQPIKVETGLYSTACASAKVSIGDTEVVVGIKFEVGTPYPDNPDQGTIIVGAELVPMSNPEFELGPPSIDAIELARVVDRGIRESKAIDFKKLCITKGEKVWMVAIDIIPFNDAGNLFDAAALAALAALKTAKLPSYADGTIDYKSSRKEKLVLNHEPISVTVLKIGNSFVVDPLIEEQKVLDARLTVASLKDGTLCALQKGGDSPLGSEEILQMVDIALDKAKELRGAL